MTLKNKMRLLFKSIFTQFGAINTADGVVLIWNEDGDLAEGYEVFVEQENEAGELEYIPAADGEYVAEGMTIVVAEGKVAEIRKEEAPAEEPAEEPAAEQMEGEEPAPAEEPAEPALAPEDITIQEPVFDAEKAYNELADRMVAMEDKMDKLQAQLAQLLEVPAEEDAFAAAKKNETADEKKFMFKARRD